MTIDLRNFVLALGDTTLIEEYYSKLKSVFVHSYSDPTSGVILDLNAIPSDLKTAVIKWLISVNLPRLKAKQEPVVDLKLILKCPVWKVVTPPLRKIALTREALFNQPKAKTINRKTKPRGINR